jgi:L-asparagine transporter-like permease
MSVRTTDPGQGLSTFDVTALVVGSIIGADVYVATAIGARVVGPASLLVWILAGVMATLKRRMIGPSDQSAPGLIRP